MSTNEHQPATQRSWERSREPVSAEDWLGARHADPDQRSPFARDRATSNGAHTAPPPPPSPTPPAHPIAEDDDPCSLPIFAGGWASDDARPGRTRSAFSLRPLVPSDPVNETHVDHPNPDHDRAHDRAYDRAYDRAHDRAQDRAQDAVLGWDLIAQYRAEISTRLTARLDKEGGRITEEDRQQLGIEVIEELVRAEAEGLVSTGRRPWTTAEEKALKRALEAALFGLGRLQPLVDEPDVENIIIIASGPNCSVWLEKTDGTVVTAPPVADSEDELREFLTDLGARQNRPFTEARPSLHLRLPGGARLAAASWVTANTSVVIRRHGLRTVSLDEMVYERRACGPVLADFLAACVRAGKSIVVSGVQGSGKTTWVRALCSCIPPWEMIGTFETEFELYLHELRDRHYIVHAWEHRPGSGEIGVDGRRAGEFTLQEALHDSFRFTLARQIVGEVRGPEVWDMLKAMESGPGSICTTHARSADHTIEKLVSCAMEKGPQVTRELAISKLAAAVDVVVYLCSDVTDNGDGTFRKRRWVQKVLVVDPSADAVRGYATAPVFAPNRLGQAVATGKLDNHLAHELARHGFDLDAYTTEANAHEAGYPGAYEGMATT